MKAKVITFRDSEATGWAVSRVLVIGFVILSCLTPAGDGDMPSALTWQYGCLIVVGVATQFVLLLALVVALNPPATFEVRRPGWRRNPYRLASPLEFFHLTAYVFLAGGVTLAIRGLVTARGVGFLGPLLTLAGVGALLGVHVSAIVLPRLFRKRIKTVSAA